MNAPETASRFRFVGLGLVGCGAALAQADAGADGVGFGALLPEGTIDAELTAKLIDASRPVAEQFGTSRLDLVSSASDGGRSRLDLASQAADLTTLRLNQVISAGGNARLSLKRGS